MQIAESQSAMDAITDKLLSWWELFLLNLPNIAIALGVLLLAYFISKFVFRGVMKVASSETRQTSVTRLIARTASVVVVMVGLILALGALNLGKALTTLISAAGVSGLVIGLALQGTLSNIFSGVVLSFRKNVQVGNWIETNGFAGTVTDINLNYFVLREADNNKVIVPNKTIIENPIKNYALTDKMRIVVACGVGYESDLEAVEKLTKETIKNAFSHIEKADDVEFFYQEFGDSSINFICRYWVKSTSAIERHRALSKGMIAIKKAFDNEGVNIPFPIRTLQFENELQMAKGQEASN